MGQRLSDEIEYAAKETIENLCNAFEECARQSAIMNKALKYFYITILERSVGLAYEQYLYAKATTKILREKYYSAKWYNKWYHKRKYFKAIKVEQKLHELYNLNKTILAKAKEDLADGLTEPSKSLDYWLNSTK